MMLKDLAPHWSLTEFVQCYRIVHFDFANASELILKAYAPRPEICLHFFLREREKVQLRDEPVKDHNLPVVLVGQQTSVINRYLAGKKFITFTIVFQPTALFRLMGIAAFELTDQYLDAEAIFSGSVKSMLERLRSANGYHEMTLIADRFIHSLAGKAPKDKHELDSVSRLMINLGGKVSLDWLATQSYLSVKQFTRKFYERTGVNPKTYLRIVRFNRAVNMKNAYPGRDWLRIALECDYFDYQHLVRDYKEFTQHTPNGFHQVENNSPERRLGLTSEVYKSRVAASVLTD